MGAWFNHPIKLWTEVILWSALERMCSHPIMATAKHSTACLFVLYLYLLLHISGWISSFKNLKDHVYSEANYVNMPDKSFRVEKRFMDVAVLGNICESPFTKTLMKHLVVIGTQKLTQTCLLTVWVMLKPLQKFNCLFCFCCTIQLFPHVTFTRCIHFHDAFMWIF